MPSSRTSRPGLLRPGTHRVSLIFKRGLFSGLLISALGLAACTATPKKPGPAASGPPVPAITSWWKGFQDPSLEALVERSLAANNRIESAKSALRQARQQHQISRLAGRPTLNFGASARLGQSSSGSLQNLSTGVDARWESDWFGQRDLGMAAADADTQAAVADLRDVQVSVTAEVALSYIQLRLAQAQSATQRANVETQKQLLELSQWRVQAGLASAADVDQAQVALAQTLAQAPTLAAAMRQSANVLATLTSRPVGDLQALVDQAAPIPVFQQDPPAAVVADILRQRPDVRRAQWRVQAARARLGEASAQRYPSFSLTGSLSLSGLNLSDLLAGSLARSVLGAWSVPLFDGGLAAARVESQEIALEQARIDVQATTQRALQEVDDASNSWRQNRMRLKLLRDAADKADQAASTTQQRYEAGLADFQSVVQAQRSAQSARDNITEAQAAISTDLVRLVKALGGGWQARD